jgi:hypothetical protein
MVPDQQEKRPDADKFAGAKHRVTVTQRRRLLDKPQAPAMAAGRPRIRDLIARRHHHADLVDAGGKYFLDDYPQRSFGNAVPIH